ncbi:MAG TPA: peptidoglycan-binding domain-containing protein, partial [Kofleriaceae bacterium]
MRPVPLLALLALLGIRTSARADDCERIAIWRDGHAVGERCRGDASEHELAILDLSDDWVPPVFAADEDSGPGYRPIYLALAQERFADAGGDAALAPADRYFELFGIAPSLGVVRARLGDEARHRCHAAIDDAPLAAAPERIIGETGAQAAARIASARGLRAELEHDRARRKLADLEALAAVDAYYRRAVDRLTALEAYLAAVRTLQAHLECDGLFTSPPADEAYTWQTSEAVARFQRGAMILPTGIVDAATRDALALGSRERDFRTALRVLRERVAAATGLIEDGTAGTGPRTVLGRELEPEATWRV